MTSDTYKKCLALVEKHKEIYGKKEGHVVLANLISNYLELSDDEKALFKEMIWSKQRILSAECETNNAKDQRNRLIGSAVGGAAASMFGLFGSGTVMYGKTALLGSVGAIAGMLLGDDVAGRHLTDSELNELDSCRLIAKKLEQIDTPPQLTAQPSELEQEQSLVDGLRYRAGLK
ncbi:MAG TPA: hypothetical protein VHA13_00935 [Gammaproteobacteria bacterium]|nr:hypothetical protein [Gammaproteobacteria bacterium]